MKPCSGCEADKLGIRLPEEFDNEASEPIAKKEHADEHARATSGVGKPEKAREHGKQDQSFQPGFVELARVTREAIATSGEHNRPRHIGGLSQSSPFTKLARRPKNRPIGTVQAT
jgi:hypothetical protein